jgi:hypothetical protein
LEYVIGHPEEEKVMSKKVIYLYQTEGAEDDFFTMDPPTKHDAKSVEFGSLSIYKFDGEHIWIMDQHGDWDKVLEGELFPAPEELKELGPYHGERQG